MPSFRVSIIAKVPIDFSNVDFLELYDVAKDPWQMSNLINHTEEAAKQAWHRRLREFRMLENFFLFPYNRFIVT